MPGPNREGLVAGVIVMGSKEKIPEILKAGNIYYKMFGSQVNITTLFGSTTHRNIKRCRKINPHLLTKFIALVDESSNMGIRRLTPFEALTTPGIYA